MGKFNFTARFKLGEKLKWDEIVHLVKKLATIIGQDSALPLKKLGNTFYCIDGEIFICDVGEEPNGLLDCNYYITKYGKFKDLGELDILRDILVSALGHMRSDINEGQVFFNGLSLKTHINKFTSTEVRATQEQVALAVVQNLRKKIEVRVGEVINVREPIFKANTLTWDTKPVKVKVMSNTGCSCNNCYFYETSMCLKTYKCISENNDVYFKLAEDESI